MQLLVVVTGTVKIYKWRKEPCTVHERKTRKECGCWLEPPYKLFCFPSELKNAKARKIWIGRLRRENKDRSPWIPGVSDRVCSAHFVDGIPTVANSDPTINMGYDVPPKNCRRTLLRIPPVEQHSIGNTISDDIDTAEPMEIEPSFVSSPASPPPPTDHSYTIVTPQTKLCQKCNDKTSLIQIQYKLNELQEIECLTAKIPSSLGERLKLMLR